MEKKIKALQRSGMGMLLLIEFIGGESGAAMRDQFA